MNEETTMKNTMLEITQAKETIHVERYELLFPLRGGDGDAGYSFPCTPKGKIDQKKMDEIEGWKYLALCFLGELDVRFPRVINTSYDYDEPAQGRCSCGGHVILEREINDCDQCLFRYDQEGQRLPTPEEEAAAIYGYDEASTEA